MRKYIFGVVLLAALVIIVAGCVTILIDGVIMPDTAYQYSSFHVTIDTHISEIDTAENGYGILGVLIPAGWEPTNVVYSGPDSDGDMSYDDFVTGHIDNHFPAPEGYVWWGFRTDDYYYPVVGNEYSADFDVLTDGQLGTFFLDFAVGSLYENEAVHISVTDLSEDNEIEIIAYQDVVELSFGAVKTLYAE
jgi:hypothetical protein